MSKMTERWVIVVEVKPDAHSGNWYRDLGEYVVGYGNQYSSGAYLDIFREEHNIKELHEEGPYDDLIEIFDTEHGPEVCTIDGWSDGWSSWTAGINFSTRPTNEQLETIVQRIRKFFEEVCEDKIEIKSIKLEHAQTKWNTEMTFPPNSCDIYVPTRAI